MVRLLASDHNRSQNRALTLSGAATSRKASYVDWRTRLISCLPVHAAFFCFLHFAQRALCAARIRAIAAADILRLPLLAMETTFFPLSFAQRARCAAAILARPAVDMVPPVPFSAEIALLRLSS
jgi:hypothetical protein